MWGVRVGPLENVISSCATARNSKGTRLYKLPCISHENHTPRLTRPSVDRSIDVSSPCFIHHQMSAFWFLSISDTHQWRLPDKPQHCKINIEPEISELLFPGLGPIHGSWRGFKPSLLYFRVVRCILKFDRFGSAPSKQTAPLRLHQIPDCQVSCAKCKSRAFAPRGRSAIWSKSVLAHFIFVFVGMQT